MKGAVRWVLGPSPPSLSTCANRVLLLQLLDLLLQACFGGGHLSHLLLRLGVVCNRPNEAHQPPDPCTSPRASPRNGQSLWKMGGVGKGVEAALMAFLSSALAPTKSCSRRGSVSRGEKETAGSGPHQFVVVFRHQKVLVLHSVSVGVKLEQMKQGDLRQRTPSPLVGTVAAAEKSKQTSHEPV